MSYTPLLAALGLTALASVSTPATFAPTATRNGVAITPAALPSAPVAGGLAIDSADGNKLKWWNGTSWQTAGGSGGGIGGTIAAGQVAYASALDTIAGSANLTYGSSLISKSATQYFEAPADGIGGACRLFRGQTGTNPARLYIDRANGTVAAPTTVAYLDGVAQIQFRSYDGAAYVAGAAIHSYIDSAVSSGVTPTALEIQTSGVTRLHITSAGLVGIGSVVPTVGNGRLQLASGTTQSNGIAFGTDTFLYRSAANTLTTGSVTAYGSTGLSAINCVNIVASGSLSTTITGATLFAQDVGPISGNTTVRGLQVFATTSGSAFTPAGYTVTGIDFQAANQNSASGTIGNLYGINGALYTSGATTTTITGLNLVLSLTGASTTAYGGYLNLQGNANITTVYGLLVNTDGLTGTLGTEYGIYQKSTTARNVFEGTVESPLLKLTSGSALPALAAGAVAFNEFNQMYWCDGGNWILAYTPIGGNTNDVQTNGGGYLLGSSSFTFDGTDVATSNRYIIGTPGFDGAWCIAINGSDFVIQRYESGSWVTKQTVAA